MSCKKKNKAASYTLTALLTVFLIGLFESILSAKRKKDDDDIGG